MNSYRVLLTNCHGFFSTTITATSADNADDIATKAVEHDNLAGWHVTEVTAL